MMIQPSGLRSRYRRYSVIATATTMSTLRSTERAVDSRG